MTNRYLTDEQILDIVHYIVPKVIHKDCSPIKIENEIFFGSVEVGEMIAYAYNIGYNRGKKGRSYLGEIKGGRWKKCDGSEPDGTKVRYTGEDNDKNNSWPCLKKGDTGVIKKEANYFGVIPDGKGLFEWVCQMDMENRWEKWVEE